MSLALFWRAFGISGRGGGGVENPQTLPLGTPLLEVTRLDNQIYDKGKVKYNPIFKIITHKNSYR